MLILPFLTKNDPFWPKHPYTGVFELKNAGAAPFSQK